MLSFVEYLLDKGADPNIGDIHGNTALHLLADYTSRLLPYNHPDNILQK